MKGYRIYLLDPDTLQPTGEIIEPCGSTVGGPFLGTDAARLECAKLAGHDGMHEFRVNWTDVAEAPASRAQSDRADGQEQG